MSELIEIDEIDDKIHPRNVGGRKFHDFLKHCSPSTRERLVQHLMAGGSKMKLARTIKDAARKADVSSAVDIGEKSLEGYLRNIDYWEGRNEYPV